MLTEAHRMLLVPKKPYLLGVTTATNTTTPITLTMPARQAGVLNIALIFRHVGGTAAPATPTGWTSLATSTTAPAYRAVYKVFNGSEGPTTTSSATSATSMSAIVLSFAYAPTVSGPLHGGIATATSTTPNPGSLSPGTVGAWQMWIPYCAWNGSGSVTEYPNDTVLGWQVAQGTNGGCAAAVAQHTIIGTRNMNAFTLSASLVNRAGVVLTNQFFIV